MDGLAHLDLLFEPRAVASGLDAEQLGEHGHAHEDSVRDLIENDRLRAVGDRVGDFDAAVHRTRMHDDRIACALARGASGVRPYAAK